MLRILAAAVLTAAGAFAGTWTGALVDAKCYAAQERNVSPRDTLTSIDRDRDYEIRYCRPGAKTTLFAIVDHDGQVLELDPSSSARAEEIAKKVAKPGWVNVTVTGERKTKTIQVDSISLTAP